MARAEAQKGTVPMRGQSPLKNTKRDNPHAGTVPAHPEYASN
jgi:hypothetical protein